MAYSAKADLLVGSIPLPGYLDADKYVDDAADEIDSKLGFVYETPIPVAEGAEGQAPRPVRLLLKRINNFLATGRLLLAVDSGGEEVRLHAYGQKLVEDATIALDAIVKGEIDLHDVTLVQVDRLVQTTPIINNLDEESAVEAFYDRVVNPNYAGFGFGGRTINSESESLR